MKNGHPCPVCAGEAVYTTEVIVASGHLDFLPGIGGIFKKDCRFEMYVCGACGYVSFFVPPRLLPGIVDNEHFQRVGA